MGKVNRCARVYRTSVDIEVFVDHLDHDSQMVVDQVPQEASEVGRDKSLVGQVTDHRVRGGEIENDREGGTQGAETETKASVRDCARARENAFRSCDRNKSSKRGPDWSDFNLPLVAVVVDDHRSGSPRG